MNHVYTFYDLFLSVPFPCPMLTPAPAGAAPDVEVVEGEVPGHLAEAIVEGSNWQAAPGRFLFRAGRFSGRFLVESGERITLQRNPAARDERLCAHLLAAVTAALLRQRGLLVLHANVVTTQRGAVAITGVSGAGKSTAQAALMARGCRMVTDDITAIRMRADGCIMAIPGVHKMNLCEDAAEKFGHDIAVLPRNPLRRAKVLVPVALGDTLHEPIPLKAIYHLDSHPGEGITVTRLAGTEKFAALQGCIYGPLFPQEHHGLFPLVSAVAAQVDIIRIERPAGRWSANEVVEAILHG